VNYIDFLTTKVQVAPVSGFEVLPEDRQKFFDGAFMDHVNEGVRKCGFRFAALDLGGYKMGNLNG